MSVFIRASQFWRRRTLQDGSGQEEQMHIVAGLGNPGGEYAASRHNIGWMVLDVLAARHGISLSRRRFEAKTGSGEIIGHKVLLLRPLTYMNLSGRSVCAAMRFHRVPPEHTLVICDDMNLPPGKIRLRAKGSDGGHNGLKSIAGLMGSTEFPRLRLGIGEPPTHLKAQRRTADYVLSAFAGDEWPLVEQVVQRAADCVEVFVAQGVVAAMNGFNKEQET